MLNDIVIVSSVRSAVGRAVKGSLALKRPDEMAGEVIRGLLARVPELKPAEEGGASDQVWITMEAPPYGRVRAVINTVSAASDGSPPSSSPATL